MVDVGREPEEKDKQRYAALTAPLSLDGGLAAQHQAPNTVQLVFSLFQNLRPGSDLTHFQLPPLFNMPKSQLQCYGEAIYCINEDMLGRCNKGKNSLERFISVIAWSISTTRPVMFGLAPFNPILGETHHASKGALNILLEQVSHHPPVSALHAVDEMEHVEIVWCQYPVPKFNGTSVEAMIHGKRNVKLLEHNETYELNSPSLQIKLFPVPNTDWAGNVKIGCKDSGYEAELCYKNHSFLGLRGNSRSVKGSIFHSDSRKTIYEIHGQWDRTVTLKDVRNGETFVLYDAKEAISKLNTPILKDPEALLSTESVMVWGEVSQSILKRDWEKARELKKDLEEKERKIQRERKYKGEQWVPNYFTLTRTKDGGWECWPKHHSVPPAPIIYHCEL